MSAQEVSVSGEINIRNYFSYDILGKVEDRILIYRDKGFTKQVDVFNSEMERTVTADLEFEKKKVDVFGVVPLDSSFQILYGYFEKDTMVFKQRTYNQSVVMVDSSTMMKLPKELIRKRFTHTTSDDKSKVLLSTKDKNDQYLFYLYDTKLKKIIWYEVFVITDTKTKVLKDLMLTDTGEFIMVMQDNSTFDKTLEFAYIDPFSDYYRIFKMDFGEYKKRSVFLDYDNRNEQFIVCGTYAGKKGKDVQGFYLMKKKLKDFEELEQPEFVPFSSSMRQDLLHGKKKKTKILDDLRVKELVHRNDGGVLIVSEMAREFSRRSSYNAAPSPRDNYNRYSSRGWVDYYYDDILVTNLNPDKSINWYKILYKKQFSQDDDAIFSSFFLMKTPSRLRFIYNDEIKRNNTVSEYLMDPVGKIARNSLLSTMHQEMKLRFQDAIQISSNSILVPSEKNYDLNLVKITY